MRLYEFRYGFGPFEGDFVFICNSKSLYVEEARLNAYHHCRNLILAEIDSHKEAFLDDEGNIIEEDFKDSYDYFMNEMTEKLTNLENNRVEFIEKGRVNIGSYTTISMRSIEAVEV